MGTLRGRGRGVALAFLASFVWVAAVPSISMASSDDFLQCVRDKIPGELVYTQCSSKFDGVLVNYIKNAKFVNATAKPLCIVTPTDASHVQAAIRCGRGHGVRLRVRSGGHDYEGLSYRSARQEVFGLLDLAALRAISVDEAASTAWVDSGATIGELYYAVAKNNPRLAFPSGECPNIGVGGHFSGGGIGMMMRKYGLSIDRVVDAKLVNANGDLLDRSGMGDDLFWAIRGGGGGNFGVVLSWKVQLVPVPATVTVFNIAKTLEQGAIDILTKWQDVAPALPSDLTITVMVTGQQAVFRALYLGECASLASTMRDRFPELNMTSADCQPMTWLQSAALSFFSFTNSKPVEDVLLPRPASPSTFSKGKSDYVRRAIPKAVWKEVYASWFTMKGAGVIVLEPHGGFMCGVPDDATPYPHRRGVLYVIQYIAFWMSADGGPAATSWLDGFYGFMAHHVTKHPREAYVNFRDLDIGQNALEDDFGVGAAENARFWGQRYFLNNYEKLAKVKAAVDPTNYFRNEQSIPPMAAQPRE
ncbi:berberine bridge enzyme-like Cyn d 4 [Hordeum vulgare subsp. vulgare]|uniref:Predicted protein n=1 Tax=Hordeum vulgare subsp. vulgare TaxID=112509 RepID=F2DJR2_HORVV|nr:berberine bridge enzyme-like Cyn d 4 [Hordeum vulgare subsp. vulgare]KAI4971121.1 hypothetical protein ZWY2020_002035 [Hordeum vulgare]BAJ95333.1 predicted protein [Hordeum vulgare subsp. vulgare]